MSKEISRLSCFAQPQVVPRLGSRWWSRHRFIAECAGRGIALVRSAAHLRDTPDAALAGRYNPLHYLALLEQVTKALDQAAPLDDRLADWVHRLRPLMEARMGTAQLAQGAPLTA
jgi:hypothetical protein